MKKVANKAIKLFDSKDMCCGCGACYSICHQKAILMLADSEGFLYPSIDDNICVRCGSCIKVCPLK